MKIVSARRAKDGSRGGTLEVSNLGFGAGAGEECCLGSVCDCPDRIAVVVKVYLQRFALGFLAFASGESLVAFLEHGVKVSFQG